MHIQRSQSQAEKNTRRWKQHGAILPLFAIGMLVLLAMAGLTLDVSHALLNKSKLQNMVDAAALGGAKVLNDTGNIGDAEAAARLMLSDNYATGGSGEIAAGVDSADASNVIVQFSSTLEPFDNGTTPAMYIRVRVDEFSMGAWLIQLLGFNEKIIGASAVAGPTPTVPCNIAPLIVCGDPDAGGPYWGYQEGDVNVLKASSKSGSSSGPIGPGNFQLARLPGMAGGADIRDILAGKKFDPPLCADGEFIPTEPGNVVGPVAQGMNTRFNKYNGPLSREDYPPDEIIRQQDTELEESDGTITLENGSRVVNDTGDLDYNYQSYLDDLEFGTGEHISDGVPGRRDMAIVIADCEGKNTGQTELPILGLGCYFILQEVSQKGNESEIYGEFVKTCSGSGNPGPVPANVPGPRTIQLYKDISSIDS